MLREALTGYVSEQLGDQQELMKKCLPDFPVFGKRLIIDNNWYQHMAREDVNLVDEPIARFHPKGIETADGTIHEFDVVVFATGFNSNRFLWPMDVVGKSNVSLGERWGEYPQAYKGMLVPDYPNLFCIYGPNTNIVHGGSITLCSAWCLCCSNGESSLKSPRKRPTNTMRKFRISARILPGVTRELKVGTRTRMGRWSIIHRSVTWNTGLAPMTRNPTLIEWIRRQGI